MDIELLKATLFRKENVEIEYKSAKGGIPNSMWETVSAFANTNGGVILFGVAEKNKKAVVDGLSEDEVIDLKKKFWDLANNRQKMNVCFFKEEEVHEEELKDGWVLVIEVVRVDYRLRPIYINGTPYGNTFKRNHEGDYHCTDDEVRQMFSDANLLNSSADGRILIGYSMEDISIATLEKYRREYDKRNTYHPWSSLGHEEFLRHIGAYRKNKATGEKGFTVAGMQMFGRTEAITDQGCLPYFFVDYREHLSDDEGERWSDRIYPDGRWDANLYEFFLKVLNRLYDALPKPFRLASDGVTRLEYTPAHLAVREALANALIHASYTQMGSIVIDRWPKKFKISNPGGMLVSIDQFYEGQQSICRNPILQKMFVALGIGEKAGSGADTIVKGWEENHWSRPLICEKQNPEHVELVMELAICPEPNRMACMVTPQATPQVTPKYPLSTPQVTHQVESLVAILGDDEMSAKELMGILGLSDRKSFRESYINPALEAGAIELTIPNAPKSSKQKYRRGKKL